MIGVEVFPGRRTTQEPPSLWTSQEAPTSAGPTAEKGNDYGLYVTITGLNPAAATRADSDFARAMAVPEALLALRDELPPKQWVSRDLALNQSVVVLTVAAWQAWVETYVSTALAAMSELPANRLDDSEYLGLLNATGPLLELAARGGPLQHARRWRGRPSAPPSWR